MRIDQDCLSLARARLESVVNTTAIYINILDCFACSRILNYEGADLTRMSGI